MVTGAAEDWPGAGSHSTCTGLTDSVPGSFLYEACTGARRFIPKSDDAVVESPGKKCNDDRGATQFLSTTTRGWCSFSLLGTCTSHREQPLCLQSSRSCLCQARSSRQSAQATSPTARHTTFSAPSPPTSTSSRATLMTYAHPHSTPHDAFFQWSGAILEEILIVDAA
jgi:hypothetical protein